MDQEPLTEEQILAKLAELEAKKARSAHKGHMPEATPDSARPNTEEPIKVENIDVDQILEEEIQKEFNEFSKEEQEKIGWGLNILGLKVEKKKNDFFANTLGNIGRKLKNGSSVSRFCKELQASFVRDADTAQKKAEDIVSGKEKHRLANISGFGNIIKYGRMVADISGASIANPLRYVMMGGMLTARLAETGKETRLKNEELIEKTRIHDADKAAEEAWSLYERAGGNPNSEDGKISAESLKKQYLMELPIEIRERLSNPNTSYSFLQKILRFDLTTQLFQIENKIKKILDNKEISHENKRKEIIKITKKYEKRLHDFDRILTQYGTVDEFAIAGMYAQTAGKTIVAAVQIETLVVSVEKLFGALSNIIHSSDTNEIVNSATATSGTRPNIEDATRGAGNVNPQDVAPTTTTPSAPSVEHIFSTKSVTFESGSGKGAIAGIAELKQQLRETYNGDFSKAPQNVRDFMNTDPTKEAMKLGLYDPTNQNESALIQEGTILKFDEHGNLLFGRPDASGNIPMLEKYHGAMLDTDHSAQASTGASTETSTTPGNPANVPETAAPTPDFSPEDPNTFQYHPDKGFKTPKEKQDEIFDKVKFGETENKFTPEELKRRIEEQIDAHTAKRGEYANAYNPPRNFPSQFRDGSGFGQEGGVVHPYTPPRNMQYYLGRNGYSALNRNLESANQSLLSPEFAKNPFHLSGEKILEVFQVHKANIDIIFPGDHIEDWEDVKYLSPSRMLGNPEYENGPEYRPIMDYLHKLVEVTKLKPKGTGLIGLGRPETTNEYIARALQKASELGKLEELKK